MSDFERQLRATLGSYQKITPGQPEGYPDAFLSAYLLSCLDAHIEATKARDEWYGLNTG